MLFYWLVSKGVLLQYMCRLGLVLQFVSGAVAVGLMWGLYPPAYNFGHVSPLTPCQALSRLSHASRSAASTVAGCGRWPQRRPWSDTCTLAQRSRVCAHRPPPAARRCQGADSPSCPAGRCSDGLLLQRAEGGAAAGQQRRAVACERAHKPDHHRRRQHRGCAAVAAWTPCLPCLGRCSGCPCLLQLRLWARMRRHGPSLRSQACTSPVRPLSRGPEPCMPGVESLWSAGGYLQGGAAGNLQLTMPLAFTMSLLAWGVMEFPKGYAAAGTTQQVTLLLRRPPVRHRRRPLPAGPALGFRLVQQQVEQAVW